ncbi:Uncharacterized protein dnl_13840 [Desulfonema limicola]|uniref:Multidrug transporter n=1 Tax=Desulfonema limicola TaxID=45656 RepID=A0A975B5F1_9BACT|nr:hypothetical protein [Desulfonema limicola]QTA79131.1 Uncharacterized protein dnl_13840 [Desulfonema limicola]
MSNNLKKIMILIMVCALIITSFSASSFAQDPFKPKKDKEVGLIAFDVLLVRPFGITAIVAGSLIFAIACPFSLLTRETKMTYQKLIKDPVIYTFKRPVGSFD